MPLQYPPFYATAEIVNASNSAPSLRFGKHGPGVVMLQGALIDLGYSKLLKKTTMKTGQPDGKFGDETTSAVKQFQKSSKFLSPQIDGIAGKKTIAALDKLLFVKFSPKTVTPVPPIPSPKKERHYMLGQSTPAIHPDIGAGLFNSKPTSVSMWALKQSIIQILPPLGVSASAFIGYDAAINMKHFMNITGADLKIDLDAMIKSVPSAIGRFKQEVGQAQKFVETLGIGQHQICSQNIEEGYNEKDESTNWYFAVGGYSTWGQGTATVTDGKNGPEYTLDFKYLFVDRYNWDGGKQVTIATIGA